jgi:hypothetical protein
MRMKMAGSDYHPVAATMTFFAVAINLIIAPILLLIIVMSNYPLISGDILAGRVSLLVVFGGLAAVSFAMEAYFPRVSTQKMVFGVSGAIWMSVFFWSFLCKEQFRFYFGELSMSIDLAGLSAFVMAATALKGVIPVSRFLAARKESRGSSVSIVHDESDGIAGICSKDVASTAPTDCLAAILENLDPPPPDGPAPIYQKSIVGSALLDTGRLMESRHTDRRAMHHLH